MDASSVVGTPRSLSGAFILLMKGASFLDRTADSERELSELCSTRTDATQLFTSFLKAPLAALSEHLEGWPRRAVMLQTMPRSIVPTSRRRAAKSTLPVSNIAGRFLPVLSVTGARALQPWHAVQCTAPKLGLGQYINAGAGSAAINSRWVFLTLDDVNSFLTL
jgi:hypothetical protein